jgi:hypothetical protein
MPSDAKKKRDLQKKAAAKQRQAQATKKSNLNNVAGADNEYDEDPIDDNDENEVQSSNGTGTATPAEETISATNVVDPNVKSLIQNLDLLAMVEKANADARSCTGKK